jgi:hypothetical protein
LVAGFLFSEFVEVADVVSWSSGYGMMGTDLGLHRDWNVVDGFFFFKFF